MDEVWILGALQLTFQENVHQKSIKPRGSIVEEIRRHSSLWLDVFRE